MKYKVTKEGLGVPIGTEMTYLWEEKLELGLPYGFKSTYEGVSRKYFNGLEISLALQLGIIEEVKEECACEGGSIHTGKNCVVYKNLSNTPKEIAQKNK